ncbi:MAG: GNAT family N-acetyltransferase [Fibrobacter sp.]|nr:GNAT family N-acetyltransferase [Fibrobacter sp.]
MFRPIDLESKKTIDRYLKQADKQCCDYAFANIYAWAAFYKTVWCEVDGFLIFRFYVAGSRKWAYLEPLGTGDVSKAIDFIQNDSANETHQPIRFFSLSQKFVEQVKNFPALKNQRFYKNRSFGNYIYSKEKLAKLAGRKLHGKRNHIAQFEKRYPDFAWKVIDPQTDIPAIQELLQMWIASQGKATTTILQEKAMIEKSLNAYKALGMFGILLTVDGKNIAFAYGSLVNANTFCLHAEKADTRYEGAYTKINQLLAQNLPAEIQYINREEDMGLESLRKAKLSYYPDILTEEYFSYDMRSPEAQIWKLWQTCFPEDDDEFMPNFIYPYSEDSSRITLYQNDRLVSMLHLIEGESSWGKIGYIYGLATDPEFRNQGYGYKTLKKAMDQAYAQGEIALWAIQENRDYRIWQTKLDFSDPETEPLVFDVEDGFDFGENPETDVGICRIIDVQAYFALYAKEHPEIREEVSVEDKLLQGNCGTYAIQNGSVVKLSRENPGKSIKSAEILKNYPISGGKLLKIAVVSRQR